MVWITVLIQKCENRYFKNLLYNYHAIVLEDRKKGLKPCLFVFYIRNICFKQAMNMNRQKIQEGIIPKKSTMVG